MILELVNGAYIDVSNIIIVGKTYDEEGGYKYYNVTFIGGYTIKIYEPSHKNYQEYVYPKTALLGIWKMDKE